MKLFLVFPKCFSLMFFLFSILINKNAFGQLQSNPAQIRVFMVGVLEWENKNEFASFDKRGRLDAKILKYFKDLGVPENQIIYLKDKEATTQTVRKAFVDLLKQSKPNETLFFYYCGHGFKDEKNKVCLANYSGANWSTEEIVKTVNTHFKGKTAFFTADCCNSGGLAKEVSKYPNKNFVALNSVVPADLSTGNWTFSNALLSGLQGKNYVDKNNDRKILLSELCSYIDEEMAIVEGQKAAYFYPKSMANYTISSKVPLKLHNRIGERVHVKYDNENYLGFIIEENKGFFNVRFYSYLNNETDWLEASKIKSFKCPNDFTIGSKVQVYDETDQEWYPAKVLKKSNCLHFIHYENYESEYDTWVSPDRIK